VAIKESLTCELKRELTPELKKEVVAFANTNGGEILIGVSDDGTLWGVTDAEAVLLQALNLIRDSIKPDISMFTSSEIKTIENKQIIILSIQRGTARPYYIADKGLKSSGVYVRQGTSSVPASEAAIRQMIKDTDGEKYEDVRSRIQELSFDEASKFFNEQKLVFAEAQMKSLNVINSDNVFTNLGLLLSDQCPHTIKAAIFSGEDKSNFKDRREFTGSLLKQLSGVYEYIDLHNKTSAQFTGLSRIDKRDYPESAIREALLNSIVHRDYSFSGSTLINIYSNRIEFVSIGGLVKGITIDDIMLGISQPRNEKLASVFYRLKLIEAYGTGISKIMASYQNLLTKPSLQVSDNAFVITIPNMNITTMADNPLITSEQIILEYLQTNPTITRKTVQELTNVGQTAAGRIIKDMLQKSIIVHVGSGRNTKYILSRRK
jgi:ATP-dependent DNA helicase RecG